MFSTRNFHNFKAILTIVLTLTMINFSSMKLLFTGHVSRSSLDIFSHVLIPQGLKLENSVFAAVSFNYNKLLPSDQDLNNEEVKEVKARWQQLEMNKLQCNQIDTYGTIPLAITEMFDENPQLEETLQQLGNFRPPTFWAKPNPAKNIGVKTHYQIDKFGYKTFFGTGKSAAPAQIVGKALLDLNCQNGHLRFVEFCLLLHKFYLQTTDNLIINRQGLLEDPNGVPITEKALENMMTSEWSREKMAAFDLTFDGFFPDFKLNLNYNVIMKMFVMNDSPETQATALEFFARGEENDQQSFKHKYLRRIGKLLMPLSPGPVADVVTAIFALEGIESQKVRHAGIVKIREFDEETCLNYLNREGVDLAAIDYGQYKIKTPKDIQAAAQNCEFLTTLIIKRFSYRLTNNFDHRWISRINAVMFDGEADDMWAIAVLKYIQSDLILIGQAPAPKAVEISPETDSFTEYVKAWKNLCYLFFVDKSSSNYDKVYKYWGNQKFPQP